MKTIISLSAAKKEPKFSHGATDHMKTKTLMRNSVMKFYKAFDKFLADREKLISQFPDFAKNVDSAATGMFAEITKKFKAAVGNPTSSSAEKPFPEVQKDLVVGATINNVTVKPVTGFPDKAGISSVDTGKVSKVEKAADGSISSVTITFKRAGAKTYSAKELATLFATPIPTHSVKGTAFRISKNPVAVAKKLAAAKKNRPSK